MKIYLILILKFAYLGICKKGVSFKACKDVRTYLTILFFFQYYKHFKSIIKVAIAVRAVAGEKTGEVARASMHIQEESYGFKTADEDK